MSKSGDNDYQPPTVGGYVVPTDKTTYIEFCYPLSLNSGWGDRSTYMVAFEGLGDPAGRTSSPNNIHHQVLYAFDGDDCSGNEQVIWVGGVTFYEDLPTDVGISFSRFRSFKVQTHYDNPAGTSGLLDDSGVRVYLDTNDMMLAHCNLVMVHWNFQKMMELELILTRQSFHKVVLFGECFYER